LLKEKAAHAEAKVDIVLATHSLREVTERLSEKERIISEKDRTLSWREQELRKTRADILKYQKERMSRSKELAEVRHSLVRKTKEMRVLKLSNQDLEQALNGKRAALKEKVKETQRLKNEIKDVKGKLTDFKLRNGYSTQPVGFGRSSPRFGKSQSWNSHRPKDLGLSTPILSRNALGNLSLNQNGISGISATQPLPRFDIDKPSSVPRFGKSRPDKAFKSSFGESSSLTQPSKSFREPAVKRNFGECSSMTQPSFLMTQKKRRRSRFSFGFGI